MFRHVKTTCVNKLEARCERSCVNLKVVETRSTFTFTRTCYFMHCFYSIYARKIYVRTNVLRDSENPPLVRRLFWIVKQTIMLYFLEKRVYNLEMLLSPSLSVEETITLSYLDSFFGKGSNRRINFIQAVFRAQIYKKRNGSTLQNSWLAVDLVTVFDAILTSK